MNSTNRHKELLHKLFNGNISELEKWELERASLDDPALNDAIEGYYNTSEKHDPSFVRDFNGVAKKERNLFSHYKWVTVAASFLILMTLSYWSFQQLQNNNNLKELSEVQKIEKEQTNDKVLFKKESKSVELTSSGEEFEEASEVKAAPIKALKKQKGTHIAKDKRKEDLAESPKMRASAFDDEGMTPPQSSNSEAIANETLEDLVPLTKRTIKGVVKDELGVPIRSASVQSQGGAGPVYTDSSGGFRLVLEEGDDTIYAVATGFSKQKLQADPNVDINLQATKELLSERPKLLVELMNINQLKRYYTEKLERHFRLNPVHFCNSDLKKNKRLKVKVSVLESNRVDNISFYETISEPCKIAIETEFQNLSNSDFFEGSQVVQFDFTLIFL